MKAVGYLLLSVALLLVYLKANEVAKLQAGILEQQTQLIKLETEPYIVVRVSQVAGEGSYQDYSILVSNQGGPLGQLTITCADYLEIGPSDTGKIRFYFPTLYHRSPPNEADMTGDSTGLLCSIVPYAGQAFTGLYEKMTRESADSPAGAFLAMHSIVSVHYECRSLETRTDAFHVGPRYAERITGKELAEVLDPENQAEILGFTELSSLISSAGIDELSPVDTPQGAYYELLDLTPRELCSLYEKH